MDQIVEGKRRKVLGLHTRKKKLRKTLDEETRKVLDNVEIDREALMVEELAKLPKLERFDALIQTHTGEYKKLIVINYSDILFCTTV